MITSGSPPITGLALLPWIGRGLESLWLLMVFLVPLAFFNQDYVISEAKIAYVEIPKVALLRTLAGTIVLLWSIEWAIKSNAFNGSLPAMSWNKAAQKLSPPSTLKALKNWLNVHPSRWLLLSAGLFFGSTFLSTVLSGSFTNSMWGEIPGQDGYSAYTIASYGILFGVIATHLKSRSQLARILGAAVLMGFLVGLYGMFQHSGHDFLKLSESTGGGSYRISIFMGNAIFSAAVLSMTILVTLVAATINFQDKTWVNWGPASKLGQLEKDFIGTTFWALILAVQLISIIFTLSRGASIGASLGIIVFLGVVALSLGWQMLIRIGLVMGLAVIISAAYLHWNGNVAIVSLGSWLGSVILAFGLVGTLAILAILKKYGQTIVLIAVVGAAVTIVGATVLAPSFISGRDASGSPGSEARLDPTTQQFANRISSVGTDIMDGFGGRVSHWKVSWNLIKNRPWFEFDDLSLSWIRPLVGYGPDLFRYTFLLKSTPDGPHIQPLEADHAHNFFIHQTVEQGVFGGVASLMLFASVFGITIHHLLLKRRTGNPVYRLLLFGLAAVILARFVEMMFGVARISDLTLLWVVFGLYTASARFDEELQEETNGTATPPPKFLRRGKTLRASRNTSPRSSSPGLIFRLGLVALLVGVIGIVTWQKSINPVRAAVAERQGIEYFQDGDFKNALEELDKAIKLAPGVPNYYNNRAQLFLTYQVQGDLTEPGCSKQIENPYQVCLGLQSLKSQLESVHEQPFNYRARVAAANSAFNLQLSDSAIGLYHDAINMVPNAYKLLNDSAETQIDLGSYDGVLDEITRSLNITGESSYSAKALYLKGRLLFEMGRYDDAIRPLKHGLSLKPSNNDQKESTMDILREIYTIIDVIHDIDYFDNLINDNSNDGVALYFRGLANLRIGNIIDAASDSLSAQTLGFHISPSPSESKRRETLKIKSTSDALFALTNALQIEPNDERYESALMIIGQSYLDLESWKAATDIFTEVISLSNRNAASYKSRGDALFALKRYQESIKDYEQAAVLNPLDSVNLVALGKGYAEIGDYAKARPYFDKSIEVNPNYSDAYASRGFMSVQSGNYSEGVPDIDQAIKLSPNSHAAYYKKAQAYIGLEQRQLALDNLDKAIILAPINSDYFYSRGLLKNQMNRLEAAIADFTISIELDSNIEDRTFDDLANDDPRYARPLISRGSTYLQMNVCGSHPSECAHNAMADAKTALEFLKQRFNTPEWDFYKPTINLQLSDAHQLLGDSYSALDRTSQYDFSEEARNEYEQASKYR